MNELTVCVTGHWQSYLRTIATLPRANGTTLTLNMPTTIVVDIDDQGTSRHVTAYGPYSMRQDFNQRLIREVKSCL